MRRIVIGEHAPLRRAHPGGEVPDGAPVLQARHYDRLRRFDQKGRTEGQQVFDWRDGYARARQWVGVVQVPGLQVEILPKVDAFGATSDEPFVRRNLLYMLAVGGDVPVRARDVARLAARRAPLSETLAAIFADRLLRELLRGPQRAYLPREERMRTFKGKLLVAEHLRANAARRDRFYCRFDELTEDTPMNRIFKAACRALLAVALTPATQDLVRRALAVLDGVTDVAIQDVDFGTITIDRQNQRFEDVLRFCRLILSERSPTVEAGKAHAFSLLFDMNKVFERFVAAMLSRYVAPRLEGMRVLPQAKSQQRHLMESKGRGVLRLEPDLLIERGDRRVVMDTKWSLLAPSNRGRGGVARDHLYQLYAYARRYASPRSVLLYPYAAGLTTQDFDVIDGDGALSGERVAIRHVRLQRDLYSEAERLELVSELEALVREALAPPDVSAGAA